MARPVLNSPALKKYGLSASGLELEFAEAQYAELEAESNEVRLVHGRYFILRRHAHRHAERQRHPLGASARASSSGSPGRTPTSSACRRRRRRSTSSTDPVFRPHGYHSYYCDAAKKGYSGVAIYSREKPQEVVAGFGSREFDAEGRYIEAQFKGLERRLRLPAVGLVERGAPAGQVPLPRRSSCRT